MNVKNFFSWGVVFFISFFISSFLGLISGVNLPIILMRAVLSSITMVLLALAFWFIIKNYFPEIYSVFFNNSNNLEEEVEMKEDQDNSSSFVHKEELERKDPIKNSKTEEKQEPSQEAEDQISFSKIWDENKDKVKDPTFSDLEKEIGWSQTSSDNSDGLKKVSKERFSSEDPQVMAQTIRNILVDDKKL